MLDRFVGIGNVALDGRSQRQYKTDDRLHIDISRKIRMSLYHIFLYSLPVIHYSLDASGTYHEANRGSG